MFPDLPVVSTDKPGWHERVISAVDGHPIGIVLDPVGGETASTAVGLLAQGGSLVSYGDLSGHPISVPALYFSTRDIRMSGVTVGRWAGLPVEVREADLKLALELAASKPELFQVEQTFDLADVGKAAALVEKPGKSGTVLIASR